MTKTILCLVQTQWSDSDTKLVVFKSKHFQSGGLIKYKSRNNFILKLLSKMVKTPTDFLNGMLFYFVRNNSIANTIVRVQWLPLTIPVVKNASFRHIYTHV
jgi:hypothetical protein